MYKIIWIVWYGSSQWAYCAPLLWEVNHADTVDIQHNSFLSAIVDHCQETAVMKLFTIESQSLGSEAGELV